MNADKYAHTDKEDKYAHTDKEGERERTCTLALARENMGREKLVFIGTYSVNTNQHTHTHTHTRTHKGP